MKPTANQLGKDLTLYDAAISSSAPAWARP
jgi:hypothetical protein